MIKKCWRCGQEYFSNYPSSLEMCEECGEKVKEGGREAVRATRTGLGVLAVVAVFSLGAYLIISFLGDAAVIAVPVYALTFIMLVVRLAEMVEDGWFNWIPVVWKELFRGKHADK